MNGKSELARRKAQANHGEAAGRAQEAGIHRPQGNISGKVRKADGKPVAHAIQGGDRC